MESLLNQKRIQARKSASDGDSIADSASQADSLDVVNRRSSHDRSIEDSSGNDSDNNTEDSEEVSGMNFVLNSIWTSVVDGLPSLLRLILTRIQIMKLP